MSGPNTIKNHFRQRLVWELKKLYEETMFYSFTNRDNIHYKTIIQMGPAVLPYLIELCRNKDELGTWDTFSLIFDLLPLHKWPTIDNETEAGKLDIIQEKMGKIVL